MGKASFGRGKELKTFLVAASAKIFSNVEHD